MFSPSKALPPPHRTNRCPLKNWVNVASGLKGGRWVGLKCLTHACVLMPPGWWKTEPNS